MKRPIIAIPTPGLTPATPPTERPEITWISPSELLIDEAYQRDLSEASLRLIRRIVKTWDWRRFKPPIVAWTEAGLEVIDGQHSAIAAETHPLIEMIPVVVVDATAQADRAQAFLGHNRDRIAITAAQMHAAAVTAGDPDAVKVDRVCRAAEVTVLRLPPAGAIYKPRTTIAAAAVRSMVLAEDEADATFILRTLADAGLAPIAAAHIRAFQHLITTEEFAEVDRETLARAIEATPVKLAEKEAKEHAATHCVPTWRGLAAVWFRAAKKLPRRKAEPPPTSASEPTIVRAETNTAGPKSADGGGEPVTGNPVTERDQALTAVKSGAAVGAGTEQHPHNPIPDSMKDERRRRHAEYVEAARKAVPAPTWSRPGGATVRTG